MKCDLSKIPAFGVAGNFTGHLEQAGEAKDFINVKTSDAAAPKAIFPTYIPGTSDKVPEFLHVFPFDSQKIIYPQGEEKLQIEPECALICRVKWECSADGTYTLADILPEAFGASNDCSIRKEGAKKISQKKNWGKASKGFSDNCINIDRFTSGGILDDYRIASFLVRGSDVFEYGEDSPVCGYSYFYKKLIDWCLEKFNSQQNEGPAEHIYEYLTDVKNQADLPDRLLLSVGATRYTDFGQNNFLKEGDYSVVAVYPGNKYSASEIRQMVMDSCNTEYKWNSDISVLSQKVELKWTE